MALTDFPGISPLSTGGASGPGVVLVPFPVGYGVFPTCQEGQGGDVRSQMDLFTGFQGLVNRTNYLGWRVPDWISGGDYSTLYRAQVNLGGQLVIDRSWAGDALTTLYLAGGTAGGYALQAFALGNGTAVQATGHGSGAGAHLTGGATGPGASADGGASGGAGLLAQAHAGDNAGAIAQGHGAGPGLVGFPGGTAGTPSILGSSGPLQLDTRLGNTSTAPGVGCMWAEQIIGAQAVVGVAANGGTVTIATGAINIASVQLTDPNGFPNLTKYYVTLTQPLHGGNFIVLCSMLNVLSGSGAGRYPMSWDLIDDQHFKLWFPSSYGGNTPLPVDNIGPVNFSFICVGG